MREISGILVTLIGLIFISTLKGEVTLLGILCQLMAGFSIGLQSLVIKKYDKTFDALSLTFWRGWGLFLGSSILANLLGQVQWSIPLGLLGLIFISQFTGLFIGRGAYIKAHEFMPISQLSFLMLSIPVMVLISTYFWLGEPLTLQKIMGATIMMIGLMWFISEKKKLTTTNTN